MGVYVKCNKFFWGNALLDRPICRSKPTIQLSLAMYGGSDLRSDDSQEEEEEEEEEEENIVLPEALALGREKRSNAGNKLRVLLDQEFEADELFLEEDNDEQFKSETSEKDEGDDADNVGDEDGDEGDNFESDKSSSGDEDVEPEDAGEQVLIQEEKKAKAAKKRRVEQPGQRQKPSKITQQLQPTPLSKPKPKLQLIDPSQHSSRRSSRMHTVNAAASTQRKLQQRVKNQSHITRQPRVIERPLTQEERMAETVITEQHNLQSLGTILATEDSRRKQQRLAMQRRRVVEPLVRVVSHRSLERPPKKIAFSVKREEEEEEEEEREQRPAEDDATIDGDRDEAAAIIADNDSMRPVERSYLSLVNVNPLPTTMPQIRTYLFGEEAAASHRTSKSKYYSS